MGNPFHYGNLQRNAPRFHQVFTVDLSEILTVVDAFLWRREITKRKNWRQAFRMSTLHCQCRPFPDIGIAEAVSKGESRR